MENVISARKSRHYEISAFIEYVDRLCSRKASGGLQNYQREQPSTGQDIGCNFDQTVIEFWFKIHVTKRRFEFSAIHTYFSQ